MTEIFIFILKIYFLLLFTGIGFTYIFLPKDLREDAFWIVPWFGLILIAIFGVILSLGKIPMGKAMYVILGLSAIFLVYALFTKKIKIKFSKQFWIIALLTLISLLFNLLPLLKNASFPTTVSLGNLDPLSYSPVADFLVNNTVFDGGIFEHYKPFLWATGDLLHGGFRWGSPMILSFFASAFNVRSFEIYSILLNMLFTLSFPLLYLLVKNLIVKYSKFIPILVFITFAINSTILYMLYNVFFAQFMFTGIYILILILLLGYTKMKTSIKNNFNIYDLLIGISLASITTIYPEGLIFVLIPLFFYITLRILFYKDFSFLLKLLKILIVSIVINPFTFGSAIKMNLNIILSSTKSAFIGWEYIPFAAPMEIMGFWNLYYSRDFPLFFDILLGIPVVIIWIIGLLKSKNRLLLLSYILTFVGLLVGLRFVFTNFFSYHRAITYSLFLFSALFSIGIVYFFSLIKNNFLKIVIITIFVLVTLRSGLRTFNQMYWHARVVDKSLVSLQELNRNEKIKGPFYTADVYLGEYDLWKRLWREYFLMDKLIVTRQNYSTEINHLEDINLVLSEKKYLSIGDKILVYKNIIWQNEHYQLGIIEPISVAEDLIKK